MHVEEFLSPDFLNCDKNKDEQTGNIANPNLYLL